VLPFGSSISTCVDGASMALCLLPTPAGAALGGL